MISDFILGIENNFVLSHYSCCGFVCVHSVLWRRDRECRQFAYYFPSPLFTAYSFPFFNSPATCLSLIDPFEAKLPWGTSVSIYAQLFSSGRRFEKSCMTFSPTKSYLFYTFSILWGGKSSSCFKERNLVILNIGKGLHRDMCWRNNLYFVLVGSKQNGCNV